SRGAATEFVCRMQFCSVTSLAERFRYHSDRRSAAPEILCAVTQGSQSLALGLSLVAASQLISSCGQKDFCSKPALNTFLFKFSFNPEPRNHTFANKSRTRA